MWCPNCKIKSPAVAVGTDDLVCAKCNTEIVLLPESEPKLESLKDPKSSRKSMTSDAAVASVGETLKKKLTPHKAHKPPAPHSKRKKRKPEVTFPDETDQAKDSAPYKTEAPETTIASAKAVTKAWSDSNRKWRHDNAHHLGQSNLPSSSTPVPNQAFPSRRPRSAPKKVNANLILCGLLVFLLGHALTIWAFLAGNFGAWSIGNFLSMGGVTVAIMSVVQAFRQLEINVFGESQPRKVRKKRRRRSTS